MDALPSGNAKRWSNVRLLRLGIMVLLASLLAGTTTITFHFTRAASSTYLSSLVHSYQEEILLHISSSVSQLLDEAEPCGTTFAQFLDVIHSPGLNLTVDQKQDLTASSLRKTFQSCNTVSGLGLTTEEGPYVIVNSVDNATSPYANTSLLWTFANQTLPKGQAPPRYVTYVSRADGSFVANVAPDVPVDIRNRPFYRTALNSPDGLAVQILVGATRHPLLVVANRYMLPGSNKVLGVISSALYLTAIEDFVEGLDLKGGDMFVLNGTTLVADSVHDYRQANQSGTPTLLHASQSSSPLIRGAFALLSTQLTDCDIGPIQARLQGGRYSIACKDIAYTGLSLKLVTILPRKAVYGKLDTQQRYATFIISSVTAGICGLGFLAIIYLTDPISKAMRLKAELLQSFEAKRQAEAREEFKTNFFAKTSHDLRTPLAAMLGILDIIQESGLEAEQSVRVAQVKECTVGLLNLLNDILDFSKIQAGQLQLETVEFDLGALLESLVDVFTVQCTMKGVELGLDMPELPPLVRGDPTRCRQIFMNLLSNSIKFTKEGYILIRCYLENDNQSPRDSPLWSSSGRNPSQSLTSPPTVSPLVRLRFELEDSGCGIPPDKRAVVFQDYAQAELSTTREHGGTGLGLGIVRTLVEMMGGSIAIGDKTGPGTLFRFDLAFAAARPPPLSPLKPPGDPPVHFNVVLGISSFLTRSLSAASMRRHGATVVEALCWRDVIEALGSLAEHSRGPGLAAGRALAQNWAYGDAHQPGAVPVPAIRVRRAQSMLFRRFPSMTTRKAHAPAVVDLEAGRSVRSKDRFSAPGGVLAGVELPPRPRSPPAAPNSKVVDCAILAFSLLPKDLTMKELEGYLAQVHHVLGNSGIQGGAHLPVAWVVKASTPVCVWDTLRKAGFSTIATKPLYESKLQRLLHTMAGTEPGPATIPESPEPLGSPGESFRQGDKPGAEPSGHSVARDGGEGAEWAERRGARAGAEPSGSSVAGDDGQGAEWAERRGARARAGREALGPVEEPEVERSDGAAVLSVPSKKETEGLSLPLKGRTVLIAEDNDLLRKLAVQAMVRLGARAVAVENGRLAVDEIERRAAAGEGRFDFVLMDFMMPVMDGLAATRLVRDLERARGMGDHVVIVALTAGASWDDQRACIEAGMDVYLTKPIDTSMLLGKVLPLLGGESSRVQIEH
ncbi:histidine kinase [Klebsormidium nitens]|uniref:Histidine kinase n=1 Tax=Klebsormidium nitens TaxID=105231 RepID=A0A1Y1HM89_KLENI|nr:histidine kinase [Klebsormidium nitens]|eukprot:GAQ77716.1 histidine kinase [Klebsormidium nitens]